MISYYIKIGVFKLFLYLFENSSALRRYKKTALKSHANQHILMRVV